MTKPIILDLRVPRVIFPTGEDYDERLTAYLISVEKRRFVVHVEPSKEPA